MHRVRSSDLASVLASALAAACVACIATPAAARDNWRERRAERQEEKPGPAITAPGDYEYSIRHDGLTRKYLVHVPKSYDAARGQAMLVGLHGGGGGARQFANDDNYGVITASEKYGFVAVFPNGYSRLRSGMLATWNAGQCCGDARDKNVDDVGFIAAVIERVAQSAAIDRNRIFVTGMSNGAMMAYRLACERSDLVRAIAPVAGTDNTTSCAPSAPVAVLHIHALDDTHVLFEGGAGEDAFRDRSKVTDFTSVPATVRKWAAFDNADPDPARVFENDGAWCDLHAAQKGGAPVKLCVTKTGGHSWPGATNYRRGKAPPSDAINANDEMWSFFNKL